MKRCNRCILPESYPDISFDRSGLCSKCREYDARYGRLDYEKLKTELANIVAWAKNQKKPFDCLVPFSGGKDSSYTLYLCRKVFGMKVLAFNFENGFKSLSAENNIRETVRRLDVAYVSYGPNWSMMQQLYRKFFLATGQFCFPCDMGIWAAARRAAEQYDVPLIVSGFSSQIESRGAKIYSYNNALFDAVTGTMISAGEKKDFLAETLYDKTLRRMKHLSLRRVRRQISIPDYMVWDDAVIKDTITRELGWKSKEDGSTDHIDCLFAGMKNYLVVRKWGFGEKTTKYSAMVRAGQITRTEALARVAEEEKGELPSNSEHFMRLLDVTMDDIDRAAGKSHLAYLGS